MANYYWIKLYYDLLDDRKVGQLPDSLKWRFIECLLFAGEQHEDGLLPTLDDMAWRLGRMMPDALTNDLSHLARAGLLELRKTGDGDRWYVTSFAKRQAKRTRADIQASYRERKRQAEVTDKQSTGYQPVTDGNTDKIRSDKIRIDVDKTARAYIPDEIIDLRTAIITQVKSNMKVSNEDEFNETAYALFAHDATPDQVGGFRRWWDKNGFYKGAPALKSLEDEWLNYAESLDGARQRELVPGVDFKVFTEEER